MDFVTKLPILLNWKGKTYDSIFVIINRLSKLIYYKPVKVTIDTSALAEVITKMLVWYYGLLNSIVSNWSLIFTSKFWFSLCYFLEIKRKLWTTFHLQTNDQIKKQNSTIEAYLWAFINFEQND